MLIGIPKELKNNENRVAISPAGVDALTRAGNQVVVETGAGEGSGFTDEQYLASGAFMESNAAQLWARADMIMKVKEPLPEEYRYFRQGLILFTYLHLSAVPELARQLKEHGVIAIAYETVQSGGQLPLLTPMSEVAGRMAVQIGAQCLEKLHHGKGVLLSGVPGVRRSKVTIIGGGVVGTNAAKIAVGLGADVTVLDVSAARLRELDDIFGKGINTLMSNPYNIAEAVAEADLIIGAVLIPGSRAPKLVTEQMVRAMSPGSVIIDVAVDQGGIFETVDRVTTHDEPTYEKFGIIHYAVSNMPGIVPRTSTIALTNVTLPYALQISRLGIARALADNPALRAGVNTAGGHITCEPVARDLGYKYVSVDNWMETISA
ncbi:alanine dehydrogenase [Paenibacillus sp. GCM10027626]|uniref:alanine dehydrogenase n=1 Tax=Paenibacillus sp. GCM10027626 TaxID=3273411 RepID=UPI003636FFA3